ncbi:unnamed protein product [Heterobilharzia americana]|nr:unnamed protein product [Heterobilharzia americana]
MEQVRHGQESWAQFDDDDNDDSSMIRNPLSVPICTSYSYFPTEGSSFFCQPVLNSHFSNLHSVNSPDQLNNLSNSLLLPFASYHSPEQPMKSIEVKSIDHDNLSNYAQNNSYQLKHIQYQLDPYNKWSSFDQSIIQQPTTTTSVLTSTVSATHSMTTSIMQNNTTSNSCITTMQTIPDPWAVTSDQKAYYLSQFLRLQPDIRSKLNGLQSKAYFELSKLPSLELSKIWELSDLDRDGQLTLGEFCVAMHLVVYRLNGVPIPNTLPLALLELVESNWLSAKTIPQTTTTSTVGSTISDCTLNSFKQSSYINSTGNKSIDTPNNCQQSDCLQQSPSSLPISDYQTISLNHDIQTTTTNLSPIGIIYPMNSIEMKQQQQQRRWSLSSQSDICSLAEGMMLFESKPNMDAQLKHPIPLRIRTLPSSIIPETNSVYNSQNISFPYRNAFYSTTNPVMIESSITSLPHIYKISDKSKQQSSSTLLKTQHSEPIPSHFTHNHLSMPISMKTPPPPPPPPPRANLLLMTNINSVDNSVQKYSLENDKQEITSPLTTTLDEKEVKPIESYLLIDSVEMLKCQCDEVSQINEELAITLMKLQNNRIALKIFLERLMPLETV